MQESEFLTAAEASHALFSSHSGLDYLRAVIADKKNYPFGQLLNIEVVAAGEGWATLTAMPSHQFYNPMMRVHGGWLASIIDSALGSAIISKLKGGTGAGTVQLSINYVGKVSVESGKLTAHAKVLHSGRTMLTASAEIVDKAGKLCVHATGAFLVYQK